MININERFGMEYGPPPPNNEQALAVLKEFGQDAEESKSTVGLWLDEKHRVADLSENSKVERLLVDIETGILFIDAGFLELAENHYNLCFDQVCDVLTSDKPLTDEEHERIRTSMNELSDKIDAYLDGLEN